jgi:hypothetical protein
MRLDLRDRRAPSVIAVVVAVLSAGGCTTATARPAPGGTRAPTSVASGATAPGPVTTGDVGDDGAGQAASTAPDPAALGVAKTFARAWARPQTPAGAWQAALRPYATTRYAALLSTVDPASVPARTVSGPPVAVSSTTAVVVIDVPTDAGALRVTCVQTDRQWLVDTVTMRPGPR